MPTTFNTKRVVFMLVTVLCLAVAVAYTWFSARKEQRAYDQPSLQEVHPAQSQTPAPLPSQTAAEKPSEHVANQRSALSTHKATADKTSTPGHSRPRLVALNMRESPDLGKVEF